MITLQLLKKSAPQHYNTTTRSKTLIEEYNLDSTKQLYVKISTWEDYHKDSSRPFRSPYDDVTIPP